MTQAPDNQLFPARLAVLPEVLVFLRRACQGAAISPAAMLRVELAIEELFTNTVRHGYRTESDAPVWLQVVAAPGSLVLVYQDAAHPYDPLQHVPELPAPLEARAVGGWGIQLIRELASEVAYRRIEDRNILTLTFQTQELFKRQSPRT